MHSTADWVLHREIDPECSIALQRDQIVTESLISKIQHSFTLHGHEGCVNTINWNDSGSILASGSDDQKILIWHQNGRLLRRIPTIHNNNIFSVLFVPHARDHLILSAAGDNQILLHEIDQAASSDEQTTHIQKWECGGRVKKLVTCRAEPRLFWSASEDGKLRQYDLRENNTLDFDFAGDYGPLKSLACNETRPEMIAIGISNAMVPIYDRRKMKEPIMRLLSAHLTHGAEGRFLATSLSFNSHGDELLVNIGSDNIYIFNVKDPDKQTSPDTFSTIKSHIAKDNDFSFMPNLEGIEKIPNKLATNYFKEHFINEINRFADGLEFTQAIDMCSVALASYLEKNRLPRHIFAIQLSGKNVDKTIANHIAQLVNDSDLLTHCLLTRGRCFMERNWEGDQVDAIRDFLSVLRFPVQLTEKIAHLNLIRSLYALKQYELAKESFSFYQHLNPNDASAENVIKKLEEDRAKDESPESTQNTQRHFDYLDRFIGHLNINTDIKEASWFGGDNKYIVAGSDCGSIFFWERRTQRVVRMLKGDNYTVNCVQPHPNRCLLASSGIDNVVRFWEPASTNLKALTESNQPEETEDRDLTSNRYELMKRNRRKRTPELVWEQLLNSVGLGVFRVDSDDDGRNEEEGLGEEDSPAIRCRQM